MVTKILFAIIGCGRIANRHAEHIINYGKLVAVCDIDISRGKNFSEKFDVPFFTNIEALLASGIELDVVVICTPNGLHAAHSIKAFQAGKHVLCEKPMAITVTDCHQMINTAHETKRLLFVVKQNRYNPPVAAVKQLIKDDKLGQLYSFQLNCFWNRNEDYYKNSWKGTRELDGGTLFTQFSHFIDLLYWYFGDVETVNAIISNYHHKEIIEFEDTGVVLLRMKNGITGTINYTVNAYNKNMEGSLTIFGEKGTVKIGGQYLNTLEYENIEGILLPPLPPGNLSNNYGSYEGSMSNHNKVYENVLAVINNNYTMDTTAEEALKTVEIISKIYEVANR